MNCVQLIGRLTRDPETRYSGETAVCHFTLAVNRQRGRDGEQQADFIRIVAFGKQAETVERYLSKGRQVAVNGRIQTGSYKDKEGRTVYTTNVIANNVEFLGGKSESTESNHGGGYEDYGRQESTRQGDIPTGFSEVWGNEDDLPF